MMGEKKTTTEQHERRLGQGSYGPELLLEVGVGNVKSLGYAPMMGLDLTVTLPNSYLNRRILEMEQYWAKPRVTPYLWHAKQEASG